MKAVRWNVTVIPETATEDALKVWTWEDYAIGKHVNLGKHGWGWEALRGPHAKTSFMGERVLITTSLGDAKAACREDHDKCNR